MVGGDGGTSITTLEAKLAFDEVTVRLRAPFAAYRTADGFVYRMVAQHETQHQETMLQALQLRDELEYAPAHGFRLKWGMRNIKLILSYDGEGFSGWQSQAQGERTVIVSRTSSAAGRLFSDLSRTSRRSESEHRSTHHPPHSERS